MQYSNPPVVFVAVEMRFPSEDSASRPTVADQRELQARFEGRDGDSWIISRLNTPAMQFSVGGQGLVPMQAPSSSGLPQLVNRTGTTSVTFAPSSVIIETTMYQSWKHFRNILDAVATFVAERLQPDGYSRLGLRYLDEIQVDLRPDEEEVNWQHFLNSTLPPTPPSGFAPETWQSTAQYAASEDRGLILRYGPSPVPLVIAGAGGGLQRRPSHEGPYFIVDTDAYVLPGTIPIFEPTPILESLDDLHNSVSVLFKSLVKPELTRLWG